MQLTEAHRKYLAWVETTEAWEQANKADLKARCARLQQRYPMPPTSLASFLLEMSLRLQVARNVGKAKGTTLDNEVGVFQAELAMVAVVLTRKERGRLPV